MLQSELKELKKNIGDQQNIFNSLVVDDSVKRVDLEALNHQLDLKIKEVDGIRSQLVDLDLKLEE